jgi:hypothetical protein
MFRIGKVLKITSLKVGDRLQHKNFVCVIQFDKKKKLFHGSIPGTKYQLNFKGKTIEEFCYSMKNVIDKHLAWCKENKQHPEKLGKEWKGSQRIFLFGPGKLPK